jgi:hypothetical protein
MLNNPMVWLVLCTIVCGAPALLYLTGRIKDPFHPLFLMGLLVFFSVVRRPLFNLPLVLQYLQPEALSFYQMIVVVSTLSLYAGWFQSARKVRSGTVQAEVFATYNNDKLMQIGGMFAIVGVAVYVATYQLDLSGYIHVFSALWTAGCILIIQSMTIDKRKVVAGLFLLLLGVVPALERFLNYGQRGDTIRLAVLLVPWYFIRGRRPSKPVFISGCVGLIILLGTITYTRKLVNNGEASNRFQALSMVIPEVLTGRATKSLEMGEEFLYGTVSVQTVRETGTYGYARGLTLVPIIRVLPSALYPWKSNYFYMHGGFNKDLIKDHTGLSVTPGAAPTGMAELYIECWWFCVIPWFVIGYLFQRVYYRALNPHNLRAHAFLVGFILGTVYLVTQEIYFALLNYLYIIIPTALAYRWSRVRMANLSASTVSDEATSSQRTGASPKETGQPHMT